ncbi:MAG: TRAP transporter small permease subunit [Gammaproteobacteria bacterium]|jgi:TRAP-type mannitol/chloroaromatic compound transport system permease small subunit
MQHTIKSLISYIEKINEWCGIAVSWCVLLMVLIISYDVFMRFVFNISSGALEELEWHLFAVIFLLGASYTLKHNGHVRVDIFYQSKHLSDVHRAWIDLLGTVFFLFPFCILIIVASWDFVARSFAMLEGSSDPGGLPYRFILKSVIPVGFSLLLLQGIAMILRSVDTIFFSPPERTSDQPTQGPGR